MLGIVSNAVSPSTLEILPKLGVIVSAFFLGMAFGFFWRPGVQPPPTNQTLEISPYQDLVECLRKHGEPIRVRGTYTLCVVVGE